eukprot:RCo002802
MAAPVATRALIHVSPGAAAILSVTAVTLSGYGTRAMEWLQQVSGLDLGVSSVSSNFAAESSNGAGRGSLSTGGPSVLQRVGGQLENTLADLRTYVVRESSHAPPVELMAASGGAGTGLLRWLGSTSVVVLKLGLAGGVAFAGSEERRVGKGGRSRW